MILETINSEMKKKIKTIKSEELQTREDIEKLPRNEWVKIEGGFEVEHIFAQEIIAKEKPGSKQASDSTILKAEYNTIFTAEEENRRT